MITIESVPVFQKFIDLFSYAPLVVHSPGRINIIGEHTDYNQGYVLPVAIDKGITVAIGKRHDNEIHLYSEAYSEEFATTTTGFRPVKKWPDYILGVVDQLLQKEYDITGFNLVLDGDIPIGTGMSSSAAVECATIFALNELFELNLRKMEMAKLAQSAEHEFAGVRCGIMDQFTSIFGKKDFAIKLDCRSLEFEYMPLPMNEYKLVLLNTNVKHSLASSEYNTRRAQCEQGVAWVSGIYPEVQSLRDITIAMLDKAVAHKDAVIYRRCRYVIEENARLLAACAALKTGYLAEVGCNMFQSHYGLSRDYEVSCKELDFLVEQVKDDPAVLGARMMGGGFGGCTINLIKEDAIGRLTSSLHKNYQQAMGLDLSVYIVQPANGTSIVK